MLFWYEWLLLFLCMALMVIGALLIYNAITGNPNFFPTVPAPHLGAMATVVPANGSIVRVDTGSDPYNCGALGNFCDPALGLVCRNGQCVCGQTGFTNCPNFGCVNLLAFNAACGSCSNTGCQPGEQCCSGGCRNVNTVSDCGSCGNQCTGPTGSAMGCCGGRTCVDLNSSATDCGACFNPIPSTGFRCCSGMSTPINDANCTSCGGACPPGFVCDVANRQCIPGCATGLTDCNGTCKDLLNDDLNCAFCNTPCPAQSYCRNGNCVTNQCPPGSVFINGQCYNLSANDSCGQYGQVCPMFCMGGRCQCTTAVDCPAGFSCGGDGQCVPPPCGPGQIFCTITQTCVSLLDGDNQGRNCGACGNNCKSGQCNNGECVCSTSADCNTGYACNGGRCNLR